MKLALIVAYARNRVIGRAGDIPWHLPEDLKRFKKITSGHSVVMGRKTFESIGRALPKRRNLVISRQKSYNAEGIEVVPSLKEALNQCQSEERVFIIGGGEIYKEAFPSADEIYLTEVHQEAEGDTFFPEWDQSQWEVVSREEHEQCTYINYVRFPLDKCLSHSE